MADVQQTEKMSNSKSPASMYPLEKEFFGFCPVEFVDNMYKVIYDYISDGVDELEGTLRTAFHVKEEHTEACDIIRMGTSNFLEVIRSTFDKNFDKFEIYALRNIFPVPENLKVSSEEKSQKRTEQCTIEEDNTEEDQLDRELEELRASLKEKQQKSRNLRAEHAVLDRNVRQFSTIVDKMKFTEQFMEKAVEPMEKLSQQAVKLQSVLDRMQEIQLTLAKAAPIEESSGPKLDEYEEICQLFISHSTSTHYKSVEDLAELNNMLISS